MFAAAGVLLAVLALAAPPQVTRPRVHLDVQVDRGVVLRAEDLRALEHLARRGVDSGSLVATVRRLAAVPLPPSLERLAAHATERGSPLWKLVASGDYPGDVGAAARKKLADFYRMISDLRRDVIAGGNGALPSRSIISVACSTPYRRSAQRPMPAPPQAQ